MIYAFYSYKGGVGRTMALANVAEFFYRAGLKVLMVDWDLEAPGLERYFPDLDLQDVLDKPGLIDMLVDYQNAMAKELDRSQTLELPSPIQYLVDIYAADPGPGKLLLMTAGRRSEGYFAQYAQAVLNFSWKEFYETWGGELYFNWLRDQFKNMADVILIDSRTGVTEMGGVCTYQLADTVVMFCAPNQQNLDGLSKMASNLTAASVQELRKHAFNLLIVPARIERAESELLDAFQQDFIEAFTPFSPWMGGLTVEQFWDLNIPYIPKYAYKEIVAVRESQLASAEDMAKAFYKLGQVLADLAGLKLLSSPIPDRTHSFDYYFIVPFVRNLDFVGRERDLARLHSALMREGPVGILPAGIIGMGGIGKTQLAVEYVYRYRELYPGGVFWINATESLAQGFARLGRRLDPSVAVRPLEQQVNAVSQYLQNHSDALLVIDNLLDVTALNRPVSADLVPAALPCRVLFTTRRRDVGRFIPIEVTVLPEDAAMRLLLRHPERHDVLDIEHPEHETAKDICAILGYLPLALEIAGAHLGRWPGSPLGVYREELLERGALPVLDDPRVRVSAEDLPTRHEAAVAVAISSQWEVLASEDARLLLRIAGQLPDATQIPTARLGLLAGLEGEGKGFFGSPLEVALQELHDAALIEPLQQGQIRLHPLVREFAIQQTPASEVSDLCLQLAGSLLGAYEDIGVLEEHCARRGVDAVQEDLVTALSLLPRDLPAIIQTTVTQPLMAQGAPEQVATVNVEIALRALLRVLQREAHVLRDWDRAKLPAFFAQQLYNRAVAMDLSRVISSVRQRLQKFS
ncbi:MAG: hypothetical protein JW981_07645, partial [Anaerolineae bacterium]|nr:hypothetical protein [Anaerolineae bacterium]